MLAQADPYASGGASRRSEPETRLGGHFVIGVGNSWIRCFAKGSDVWQTESRVHPHVPAGDHGAKIKQKVGREAN